jgi:hypothetical protein
MNEWFAKDDQQTQEEGEYPKRRFYSTASEGCTRTLRSVALLASLVGSPKPTRHHVTVPVAPMGLIDAKFNHGTAASARIDMFVQ